MDGKPENLGHRPKCPNHACELIPHDLASNAWLCPMSGAIFSPETGTIKQKNVVDSSGRMKTKTVAVGPG